MPGVRKGHNSQRKGHFSKCCINFKKHPVKHLTINEDNYTGNDTCLLDL